MATYLRTEEIDRPLAALSHNEFYDWLIFQSPQREIHYSVVSALRYLGDGSGPDAYVTGMRNAYAGTTDAPVFRDSGAAVQS